MQGEARKDVEEKGQPDHPRAPGRRIMAVGKRVKDRWLIQMSLANPRGNLLLRTRARAAHAA
jgi:hypothetical protein